MLEIFVDFETRSKVTPKDVGLMNYANHPSTLPLMMAYGIKRKQKQWVLPLPYNPESYLDFVQPPNDWVELIGNKDVQFHAHNAGFEIAIYDVICRDRWGWPAIPLERWRCTLAKASHCNQPRGLARLSKRIAVADDQKNKRGKFLIDALSQPTKAQKTARKVKLDQNGQKVKEGSRLVYDDNPLSEAFLDSRGIPTFDGPYAGARYFFCEDVKLMAEFQEYNVQDVIAEIAADRAMPEWPGDEQQVWLLDRRINMRGIPIDLDLCRGAMQVYDQEVSNAHAKIDEITDGQVEKCTQRQRIVDWLNERMNFGPSLADPIIPNFLRDFSNPSTWREKGTSFPFVFEHVNIETEMPKILEVLRLRDLAGGTAVAKYKAALAFTEPDGRARDQMLYHGAATGRWTGRGIQPHNMKKAAILDDTFIRAITSGSHATVEAFADMEGLTVMDVLKKCVRGLIRAPKGKKLIVSDFVGIEARVLHWVVRNEPMLELFRNNQDVYIHTALDIYRCEAHEIAEHNGTKWKIKPEHQDKRDVGKVATLGLGFGMGWAKFQSDAKEIAGQNLSDEFAQGIVSTWRESNPLVTKFWSDLQRACKRVIWNKRKTQRQALRFNGLMIHYHPSDYLCIRLPSGRDLFYYRPWVDEDSGNIYYMDGSKTGKAENRFCIDTYGGKLCENVIQGIARDLLSHSMFCIDRKGLDIDFHVHDESVVEADENDGQAFGIVHRAMQSWPSWAAGLPLAAETYQTQRYTK